MDVRELTLERFVTKAEEQTYFLLPFSVPEGVERIDVHYAYERHVTTQDGKWERKQEVNIIDLALCGTEKRYIGASGSDRTHVYVSARESAQGYAPIAIEPGEWNIVVGAYKVHAEGVKVVYSITFTMKQRHLIRGDMHMHTLGSDGHYSPTQVAEMGRQNGLDFVFITDHNNYAHNLRPIPVSGITVLPGTEWTHYNGHMGMLGVPKPYENAFLVNTEEEACQKILEARKNGAFLVLNHPFCPNTGWKWGMDMPFDGVELWNGAVPDTVNDAAVNWWHQQLVKGCRIPITGGSDFHKIEPYRMIGMPTTCLFADSTEPSDLLSALREGRSFLTWHPEGPTIKATAGSASFGEAVVAGTPVSVQFEGLHAGDELQIITDLDKKQIKTEVGVISYEDEFSFEDARFVRFEVHGIPFPGLPVKRKLLSSPIYFERE